MIPSIPLYGKNESPKKFWTLKTPQCMDERMYAHAVNNFALCGFDSSSAANQPAEGVCLTW